MAAKTGAKGQKVKTLKIRKVGAAKAGGVRGGGWDVKSNRKV